MKRLFGMLLVSVFFIQCSDSPEEEEATVAVEVPVEAYDVSPSSRR